VSASLYAFDKILTKRRCLRAGVGTARFERFINTSAQWPEGWQTPVVLKPTRQGSSVGLQFVDRVEDFSRALAEALGHGGEVLMEERIVGRETTVGILEGLALPVVEVCPKSGSYDYNNKYTAGRTDYFCPADLEPAVTHQIQQAALAAFNAIGGRDYARVDVMVRPQERNSRGPRCESARPVLLRVNQVLRYQHPMRDLTLESLQAKSREQDDVTN
jgi:D-alanine-D-alanine ligase